jgi:hypothetical protein
MSGGTAPRLSSIVPSSTATIGSAAAVGMPPVVSSVTATPANGSCFCFDLFAVAACAAGTTEYESFTTGTCTLRTADFFVVAGFVVAGVGTRCTTRRTTRRVFAGGAACTAGVAGTACNFGTASVGNWNDGSESGGNRVVPTRRTSGVRTASAIGPKYAAPKAARPIPASQKRIARERIASGLSRSAWSSATADPT